MGEPIAGKGGAGSVVTYTTPRNEYLRVELVAFTITTGAAAGVHTAQVTYTDQSGLVIATLADFNELGGSQTNRYTFGIGLIPFSCTVPNGMAVQDALPDTVLRPQTAITITAVDDAGATIAGDTISNVALYALESNWANRGPDLLEGSPWFVPTAQAV